MPTEDGKPIILSLNGGYRLVRNDPLNLCIQRKYLTDPNHQLSKGIAQVKWSIEGYYSVSIKGFELALEKLLGLKILEKDHDNIRVLLTNIIKAREEVKQAAKAATHLHPQLVK